jgi:hypothetical protein
MLFVYKKKKGKSETEKDEANPVPKREVSQTSVTFQNGLDEWGGKEEEEEEVEVLRRVFRSSSLTIFLEIYPTTNQSALFLLHTPCIDFQIIVCSLVSPDSRAVSMPNRSLFDIFSLLLIR